MKRLATCALAFACQQSSSPPPPLPPPPVTPEMKALADGFSPEYVGVLVPKPVVAGSYSMTLDMSFTTFETPELELTANRHGALMVTLAPDGSVTGCIVSRGDEGAAGQREYERDPAKRKPYRGTKDEEVGAVRGLWNPTSVEFDQVTEGSCDPKVPVAQSLEHDIKFPSPRCITTAKTALLPEGTLVCDGFRLGGLGMPFMPPNPAEPVMPPKGTQVLLAPAGISVMWTRDNHDVKPTIKIRSGAVDPALFKK